MYLLNNGWGLLLSILIPLVIWRLTIVRSFRDLEGWEMFKATLMVAATWFVLAFLPGNLVWAYDLVTWIDYDIVFIVGLVLGFGLMIYYRTRTRCRKSEMYIWAGVAAFSFLYILGRVVYLYTTDQGKGLLSLLI